MHLLASFALLLTIAGWVLAGLTGMHLLSGYLEERTCQTDCVKSLFYSSVATGIGGLILSATAFFRSDGRILSITALVLSAALCTVFATLVIIGNLG